VAKSAVQSVQSNQLEFNFDFRTLATGMKDLIRTSDAARILDCSPDTVIRYYNEGLIPGIKRRGTRGRSEYRFVKVDILQFIERNYGRKTYDN
jgi:hypothetical protein